MVDSLRDKKHENVLLGSPSSHFPAQRPGNDVLQFGSGSFLFYSIFWHKIPMVDFMVWISLKDMDTPFVSRFFKMCLCIAIRSDTLRSIEAVRSSESG